MFHSVLRVHLHRRAGRPDERDTVSKVYRLKPSTTVRMRSTAIVVVNRYVTVGFRRHSSPPHCHDGRLDALPQHGQLTTAHDTRLGPVESQ